MKARAVHRTGTLVEVGDGYLPEHAVVTLVPPDGEYWAEVTAEITTARADGTPRLSGLTVRAPLGRTVSARGLRELSLIGVRRAAVAAARLTAAAEPAEPAEAAPSPTLVRAADAYRAAVGHGSLTPARDVAVDLDITRNYAKNLIFRARRHGLLGPVER